MNLFKQYRILVSKLFYSLVILSLSLACIAQEQSFFIVGLANKKVEYKRTEQSAWTPLKNGDTLTYKSELSILPDGYVMLICSCEKQLEIKTEGIYYMKDLIGPVLTRESVLERYTQFVMSSSGSSSESKSSTLPVWVYLPIETSQVLGGTIRVTWASGLEGPYEVRVSNDQNKEIVKLTTRDRHLDIDLSRYTSASGSVIVSVSARNRGKEFTSLSHTLHIISKQDRARIEKAIKNISPGNTALSKTVLAGFFEENNLLADALRAHEEAISLEPENDSFREVRDDFLKRHGIY